MRNGDYPIDRDRTVGTAWIVPVPGSFGVSSESLATGGSRPSLRRAITGSDELALHIVRQGKRDSFPVGGGAAKCFGDEPDGNAIGSDAPCRDAPVSTCDHTLREAG